MNRDNFSALIMAIGVIGLISGFAIYFNNPELNKNSNDNNNSLLSFTSNALNSNNNNNEDKSNLETINLNKIDKSQFRKTPELEKVGNFINTEPITLQDLRGKVVILDFWTYSCINCIRTIPYLNDWYEKYADKGLVILGVHTPEFSFEKDLENVKKAVEKFGIKYPVVQDNDKGTWNAFANRYWPHKYIIDTEGFIRYDHIGEGGYAETEKVIQALLTERANLLGIKNTTEIQLQQDTENNTTTLPANAIQVNFSKINTPELYFGYNFARDNLGNTENFKPGQIVNYSLPKTDFKPNAIYLEGEWKNNPDNMELQSENGRIVLVYSARDVNIVAGGNGEISAVINNGKIVATNQSRGDDVSEYGSVKIDSQRLYNIIRHDDYDTHSLILDIKGKGFQIYTFTFG